MAQFDDDEPIEVMDVLGYGVTINMTQNPLLIKSDEEQKEYSHVTITSSNGKSFKLYIKNETE